MIAIIDYGMGNIRSIINACEATGMSANVISDPEKLGDADGIILPGVGAFGDGIAELRNRGWVPALEYQVRERGKPFLGICLGMHLIAAEGTENGTHEGLGWISGRVERLSIDGHPGLRLPHIGWNSVQTTAGGRMYAGLDSEGDFYFVHSYALAADGAHVNGVCVHGSAFAASIEKDNIWAVQYHPEKSHSRGISVFKNWKGFVYSC